MTTTDHSDRKVSAMTRTYETVSIHWAHGAVWSDGYTEAEAEAIVKRAAASTGRIGVVEVSTFTVEIDPKFAHLYMPGI